MIHTDLGTGDHAAIMAMATWLGPVLDTLVGPGGYVLANQALEGRVGSACQSRRACRRTGIPLSGELAGEQPQQHQQYDRANHRADEAAGSPN